MSSTAPDRVATTSAQPEADAIISSCVVDGTPVVLSRYGDEDWLLPDGPTNRGKASRRVQFGLVPEPFRNTLRAVSYRYMTRGRAGLGRPSARAVIKLATDARPFLRHLHHLGITSLADVTPETCRGFVEVSRQRRQTGKVGEQRLKSSALSHLLFAVEALHELSQFTDDAMPAHPWPETSAAHLAGLTGPGTAWRRGGTPLIPDDVFAGMFQRAWSIIQGANEVLAVREEWQALRDAEGTDWDIELRSRKLSAFVRERGWRGAHEFRKNWKDIRVAGYVVIASLSGCRVHELSFLQSGAVRSVLHPSPQERGGSLRFWWMKARSTKTGDQVTEWMIPSAAATAVRVLERWAGPYQALVDREIQQRRATNPQDPEIAEAFRHHRALFIGSEPRRSGQVRTLTSQQVNNDLRRFVRDCGFDWNIASHQFRRKFANYAARSQFGDLRYLKQHFKHWSLDMTLMYALNDSQELDLFGEIRFELDDIKNGVVSGWLESATPLAGGYGERIAAWRDRNPVTIFKSHAHMVRSLAESTPLRSTGHSWCTADDNQCVGNDLERTRCSSCENAVIGPRHRPIYRGLLNHLEEVARYDDIGAGGKVLVLRDMRRCTQVLAALSECAPGSAHA